MHRIQLGAVFNHLQFLGHLEHDQNILLLYKEGFGPLDLTRIQNYFISNFNLQMTKWPAGTIPSIHAIAQALHGRASFHMIRPDKMRAQNRPQFLHHGMSKNSLPEAYFDKITVTI